MSNKDLKSDDFFDTSDVDEIDRLIAEDLAKPTLLDQLEYQSNQRVERKAKWMQEVKEHPFIYGLMAASMLFTGMLGLMMGLAPYRQVGGSIYFHDDFEHIATAIVYMITFWMVTEVVTLAAQHKFYKREQENFHQLWSMVVSMAVGWISVIGTGIAGGSVVASVMGFLSEFNEIPAGAQRWVVFAIPCLIAIHGVMFMIYKLSSRKARQQRIMDDEKAKRELDHKTRMDNIDRIGERAFQVAEIKLYSKAVMSGRLSAAEAAAARRAGKTLQQLEKELGRDLDGNSDVGTVAPIPRAIPATQHANGQKPVFVPRNFTVPAPKRKK